MNMKKYFAFTLAALMLISSSMVFAHEKVTLTGYVVDVLCMKEHLNDNAEALTKFAAEHSKECALMDECIKSGYGIVADGKWYPFDAKGNELAKALFDKTQKKDHIKMTVDGMKHDGKLMVEKLVEVN